MGLSRKVVEKRLGQKEDVEPGQLIKSSKEFQPIRIHLDIFLFRNVLAQPAVGVRRRPGREARGRAQEEGGDGRSGVDLSRGGVKDTALIIAVAGTAKVLRVQSERKGAVLRSVTSGAAKAQPLPEGAVVGDECQGEVLLLHGAHDLHHHDGFWHDSRRINGAHFCEWR